MSNTSSALSAILADQNKSLLSNTQAAEHLGIEPGTLEVWRCTKRHVIPYIKAGRLVKYRKVDLDAWLESRIVGVIVEVTA